MCICHAIQYLRPSYWDFFATLWLKESPKPLHKPLAKEEVKCAYPPTLPFPPVKDDKAK